MKNKLTIIIFPPIFIGIRIIIGIKRMITNTMILMRKGNSCVTKINTIKKLKFIKVRKYI